MSVELIIKSASQNVEDFNLKSDLLWTIGELKDQISALYPTKPKKEHQKLIYGGKLLPDHLSLKSVLNSTQELHTVHLVCPFPQKTDADISSASKEKSTAPPPAATFTAPPPNPVYSQMNPQIPISQYLASGVAANVPVVNTPADAIHQYLAMQQMYNQFLTQYLSQYNNNPSGIPYGPLTPPVQQSPPPPLPQRNIAPERPPEEEERDYIDYLYAFSRALILFVVLYYYSSISRIILVIVLVTFISLYVKFNRAHQLERAIERQRTEAAASQRTPADIQATGNEEHTVTENPTEPIPVQPHDESRSLSSVVVTVLGLITSFFTSLIPTEPVPVNVN